MKPATAQSGEPEILIAGGGLVGAALALALKAEGLAFTWVDAGPAAPVFDPAVTDTRVYALAPRSIAWLETLGVWSRVQALRATPYHAMRVWGTDPARPMRLSAPAAGLSELGSIVEHGVLAEALANALGAVKPQARPVTEAHFVAGERPAIATADGGIHRPRLAVAADGALSTLRAAAGTGVVRHDYLAQGIVATVAFARPHGGIIRQRFLPPGEGVLALLPVREGRVSIVWSVPSGRAAELLALPDDAFGRQLAEATQQVLGPVVEVSARKAFPLALSMALAPAEPELGLAYVGDAARAIHPLAGQGLNLGLDDARDLVAAIAGARGKGQDWLSARVLARYARQALARGAEWSAITHGFATLYAHPHPVAGMAGRLGLELAARLPALADRLGRRAL